ncbi:MAG: hypothetical protein SNF68_08690 [Rikenellaceae bacterium]
MIIRALRRAKANSTISTTHATIDYQQVSVLRWSKLVSTEHFLTILGGYYTSLPNLLSQLVLYSPKGSERSELQRAATEKLQQLRTSIAWAIRSPHSAIDLEAIHSIVVVTP